MAALQGKIALITGGSRGIGAAIAIEFARLGAEGVAITYVTNKEMANQVLEKVKGYGARALAVQADLGDPNVGNIVINATLQGFSTQGIDILVNNAAIAEYVPFESVSDAFFAKVLETNVRGPIKTVQAALPVLRKGGRIINISSRAARRPMPGMFAVYACSKAALEALTRSLATEYSASMGITVNSIMPGPVATDALAGLPQSMLDHFAGLAQSEKRLGRPEDVAKICGFLADSGSVWVNGDTISATGGLDML